MRKIKEVFRLHFESGLEQHPIDRCLGLSRTTVGDYLRKAKETGLVWPLSDELIDQQLYHQLFPPTVFALTTGRPVPDYVYLHTELKCKGVTKLLLWEEYQSDNPHARHRGLPPKFSLHSVKW